MVGVSRQQFTHYVMEALSHLYDHAYLQNHPLARLLEADSPDVRGVTLHRLLLEAIQQLAPPPATPFHTQAWRKHRYLVLRYIEARPVSAVARELAISERQSRRYHQEAVEALSALLWERYLRLRARGGQEEPRASGGRGGRRDRSARQTDDLTAFTEGETGSSVHLVEALASALATLRPLLAQRQVRLTVEPPPDAIDLLVSRAVFRQIVVEGMLFLLDATGAAQLGLTVADGPGEARLQVRAGAPARRPPARVAGERLTIARWLLERHGGRLIDALDEPNGPALTFVFPARPPSTVLVIDDNPDARRLFQRFLSGAPYRVVVASGARDALALAVRERPAAIVLDIMLPGVDGWELLQTLRHHPETQAVPIVVCSVLHEPELARALGATEVLTKPVTQQALLQTLARCLGRRVSPERPASPVDNPSDPPP